MIKKYKNLLIFILLEILLISIAFVVGLVSPRFFPIKECQLEILNEARQILVSHALFELPEDRDLEYGMIRGMLETYNEPHTVFVEPHVHEIQTDQLNGKFGGIGARTDFDFEGKILLFAYEHSPAKEAGLQDGDILIQIDDWIIPDGSGMEEVQAAIRGPIGKVVKLVIQRNKNIIEYKIRREEVVTPSVTYHLALENERVGVIQINIISETTPDEVSKAIEIMVDQGAEGFIIDLRNNSGGLLESGVETARLFLEDGTIIEQQYKGQEVRTFYVGRKGLYIDLPIVILINHGTASAAEIIAGSLQANGRARLVGTPSFGKETIQLVFDLRDGSSLHVTSGKWWIPGLETQIKDNGLIPDVMLTEEEANDGVIIIPRAIQVLLNQ